VGREGVKALIFKMGKIKNSMETINLDLEFAFQK
jgi:hypothetical protein